MLLNNLKQNIWSIFQTNISGIDIQLGRLGSGNIVEGQSWSNGFVIYMPLTPQCAYSSNGTVLDKHSFIIMEPGCDFCISTKDEHDWCSIFVPTHQIAYDNNLIEPSSGSKKMICRVSPPNRLLANQFWALVQSIAIAANYEQFESSPAGTFAAAELKKVASLIVGREQTVMYKQGGRPKLPRHEVISRSKALLEEREGEPVQVSELVTAVGVSERTLRTAFNEYFGVGPIKYLQLRQLHQIHRELKKAAPEECTVGKVMVKYGVWEFSRCASRYRQLFGELPSETLRKVP
ncbi:MAG: helix-turn-helix domain-containing protein [Xenococcus sp. MO_188.B8]|nr:helix-turn-helix domain-containing protein [Xenococcus sp. MO_188.B8]